MTLADLQRLSVSQSELVLPYLHAINAAGLPWPVIFMTGFGTIPMSVQAMKAGAVEFLTKPFNDDQWLDILRPPRQRAAMAFEQWQRIQSARQRAVLLTPHEREVLPLIVAGMSNKHIANRLGTSEVTAKVHRKHGPWGKQYPTVVAAWRRAWDRVIPFFVFPPAIRKVIYTTVYANPSAATRC